MPPSASFTLIRHPPLPYLSLPLRVKQNERRDETLAPELGGNRGPASGILWAYGPRSHYVAGAPGVFEVRRRAPRHRFARCRRIEQLKGGTRLRTLIHLSDLHFGRIDRTLIRPLLTVIEQLQPDLIAVSGDLTQRARSNQFREARAFLSALPFPQIIVPGNHDVPLYNPLARFLGGLERYRRYMTDDLEPSYADAEIVVLGLNTARSFTFSQGRINATQIASAERRLRSYGENVIKIIVTHHPFDVPERYNERAIVGRARTATERLASCKVDVFLAGHLHISHAGPSTLRIKTGGRSSLLVQAGTATSTRGRGEANAFNVIRIQNPDIAVERFAWEPDRQIFIASHINHFRRTSSGWSPWEQPDLNRADMQILPNDGQEHPEGV
jgi:3',5'-cyclic AMP phosphodiesterase CpdA